MTKCAYNISPSAWLTKRLTFCSMLVLGNSRLKLSSKNSSMSFSFFSSEGWRTNGLKWASLSIIACSVRPVITNFIQDGSLWNCVLIISKSSFLPWCSHSSTASTTKRMFIPGSAIMFVVSWRTCVNSSSTFMVVRSVVFKQANWPVRTSLKPGRLSHKCLASDCTISSGFLLLWLLCWQKCIPPSTERSFMLWHNCAAITDLPIPAFPVMIKTRESDMRFWNQLSTWLKTHVRVPGWCLDA